MKFYRLEKTNYFKTYLFAIIKSLFVSLLICVALMVVLGYKFMIVSSGSMEPTLPVGSLIIVTPCDYDDLELGDIVTMNKSSTYLTHRVAGKKIDGVVIDENDPLYNSSEARWYTKGDANESEEGDAVISDGQVVGTVHHCFKSVGVVVRYVKANYKVLIILGIIMLVFIEVLSYLKDKLATDDVECYENDDEE